ncbi:hypothetical protein GCM10010116_48990 [Microbispora rosea subsp. aerata]|nr:hypothetical protein GCM10010116_48990 [Microbispora rosea subsp. aerata]
MVTADRRASTRAIRTSADTIDSTRVGTPTHAGISLAGVSTGTSASVGTCAITGGRLGIPLAGIRTSTSAHANAGNPVGAGATGTGSRAVGTPATSTLALNAERRATGGKAVTVPDSATGTGSHVIGTPAITTDTGSVSGEGVISGSVVSAGRTTTTGRAMAGARSVMCLRSVARPRTATCLSANACAAVGEGVIAPASAKNSTESSVPGSGTAGCPAPTAMCAADPLPRGGVARAGVECVATSCAARERGTAARGFIRGSVDAGRRTAARNVGRK